MRSLLLSLLLVLGPPLTASGQAQGRTPPNVIVVVGDDFSWQDLAVVDTPSIDYLAASGLSFKSFYTMPVCTTTRTALWTGRWPRRMGIVGSIDSFSPPHPVSNPTPSSALTSLPKLLKSAGYRTCLVGKWHMGQADWGGNIPGPQDAAYGPHAHGFDHWLAGAPANLNAHGSGYESWFRVDDGVVTDPEVDYATRAARDAAVKWWNETEGPKFLVVSTSAAHGPYHVPPADMIPLWDHDAHPIASKTDKFLAMLQSLDTVVSELLQNIGPEDWFFLLSDNGTPPTINKSAGKGKKTTFDRGVRVPMFVMGPGIRHPGENVDALVSCTDLYGTIAMLAHLRPPHPDRTIGGEDSVPFVGAFHRGAPWRGRRHWVMSEQFEPALGYQDLMVRNRRWKLRQLRDPLFGDQDLLYDLETDRNENRPVDGLLGGLTPEQEHAYDELLEIAAGLPPRG